MWHLTKVAVQNRIVVFLLIILIVAVSIWAFFGMKTELIPDIKLPYTSVITYYPQASPEDVASKVTTPIENVIWERYEGKGLKHLDSTSAETISVITAEFEYGTNMGKVNSTIRQDIGKLDLPQEVLSLPQSDPGIEANPRVIPIDMNSIMPLVTLSLSGDLPPDQLKEIADTQILPALKDIKGVLSVDIEGGDKDQVVISPDPLKMNEHSISMSQIEALLNSKYESLNEVRNISMETGDIVLKDIAEVDQEPAPTAAVTRYNGHPSITIKILKNKNANAVDVADAVVAKAKEIDSNFENGLKLEKVMSQADYIKSSINDLRDKALIGGALAIIIVFLFLMTVRASLITAISIPLSMMVGFLTMRAFDITINMLTLSAISIAIGRLIDDSIVMVEVVYRRLQRGEHYKEAAINGAKEIANPITSATLATVAIFLPLMFVGGIVGQLFIPFALTVTFAMIASLLVALMVVPALSNLLVNKKTNTKVKEHNDRTWYLKSYLPILKWALSHRALTLIIAVVIFISSLGLFPLVGTSFLAGDSGEKQITISIQMAPGTDLIETSAKASQVENLLVNNKSIKNYATTVGTPTSLMGAMSTASGGGSNTAQISILLKSSASLDKEVESLRLACNDIDGGQGIAVTRGESGGGMGSNDVDISIQGDNYNDLSSVTNQLTPELEKISGVENLNSEVTRVISTLSIKPDQEKAAALGLSAEQLDKEYSLLMVGANVADVAVYIDGVSYPVYISGVGQRLSNDVSEAKSIKIGWPNSVALGDIADVQILERPTHISHADLKTSAKITGVITAKDVGGINSKIQNKINKLPSHPGVEVKMGGVSEEMKSTFNRMGIAIIIAILISFLIIVIMMRSIINPLIIMVSLPLATIGALLGLIISGHTIGVSAMMGMLMLVGIVLTNAIVLIALVEQLRKGGMKTNDALITGAGTRLRPILMTALTTIFAMIPLALGVESGGVLAAELAVVVIGGLFSSTVLTLVVIPVTYSLVDGWRQSRKK